jgi:aminoglycoside phosphotransferase (APT) family kinase protein
MSLASDALASRRATLQVVELQTVSVWISRERQMYSTDALSTVVDWFAARHAPRLPATIKKVSYPAIGFSASTILLDITVGEVDQSLVIRVPNERFPVFLDSTMIRQVRMMQALRRHGAPVPEVLDWNEDPSMLDGPFLVMKRCDGEHLPAHPSYRVEGFLHTLGDAGRDRAWRTAVKGIARINRVRWQPDFHFLMTPVYGEAGLDHYLGWLRAWRKAASSDIHPIIDAGLEHLARHKPTSSHADLLWGDSNPCNFLFSPNGEASTLLDFEAASIGPAEIDLAWWFFMDEMLSAGNPVPSGTPSRDAQILTYEETLGRRVSNLEYYEVLAAVRMSLVVLQTTQRLIEAGRLSASNCAALANPACFMLARRIGIHAAEPSIDYTVMVSEASKR